MNYLDKKAPGIAPETVKRSLGLHDCQYRYLSDIVFPNRGKLHYSIYELFILELTNHLKNKGRPVVEIGLINWELFSEKMKKNGIFNYLGLHLIVGYTNERLAEYDKLSDIKSRGKKSDYLNLNKFLVPFIDSLSNPLNKG